MSLGAFSLGVLAGGSSSLIWEWNGSETDPALLARTTVSGVLDDLGNEAVDAQSLNIHCEGY